MLTLEVNIAIILFQIEKRIIKIRKIITMLQDINEKCNEPVEITINILIIY